MCFLFVEFGLDDLQVSSEGLGMIFSPFKKTLKMLILYIKTEKISYVLLDFALFFSDTKEKLN